MSQIYTAGLPEATLQNQLRRLTEIEALLRQRQESEDSPLPPLDRSNRVNSPVR
jgi:hypothetical protein